MYTHTHTHTHTETETHTHTLQQGFPTCKKFNKVEEDLEAFTLPPQLGPWSHEDCPKLSIKLITTMHRHCPVLALHAVLVKSTAA